jgi:nitrous oxidase accessory protein NosD
MFKLFQAYMHLFQPLGCAQGKGAIDLVACRQTAQIGNRLSALGDTMHLQYCHDNVFANNQITGSRMGAFFIAEYCKNTVVTGNTVDGTNGSRVMSVEKSSENVTIVGNTFRNGGRGSWINQPQGIILQGNVFVNNTTKGERDPRRGRRSFKTGDYERFPELYFTIHEPDGRYGPAIIRDNLFVTGPECAAAIEFGPNGHDLIVEGNVFEGAVRSVRVHPGCERVHVGANIGMEIEA